MNTAANEDFIVETRRIIFPASMDGTTRCTTFDIVDDDIALEGTETFRVAYIIVSPPGTMRGPVSEAWVDITENDGEKGLLHTHTHTHTLTHKGLDSCSPPSLLFPYLFIQ